MAPKGEPGRCHPTIEAAKRFQAILPDLKKYLEPSAVAEDGTIAAPSADLAAYIVRSLPTIGRAKTLLLTSPAPVWKLNLALGFDSSSPNYLGFLNLGRLLVAQAREQARAGQIDAAFETLEAAWMYNQAALKVPKAIGLMICELALKEQLAVLRGMPRLPTVWRARLAQVDLRGPLLVAHQAEAFAAYRSSKADRPPADQPDLQGWPLVRWGMHDYAWRYQAMIDEMAQRDVRSFDPDDFDREMLHRIPNWQFVGRLLLPKIWDTWPRTAHLELAAELTVLGLEERERLAVGASSRGYRRRASRVKGLRWVYEGVPEGTRIRLGGRFLYPGTRALPLTFLIRHPSLPAKAQKETSNSSVVPSESEESVGMAGTEPLRRRDSKPPAPQIPE